MTKQTFYKKVDGEFVPVSEYDSELCSSFPEGTHVVYCRPGVTSRRYNVDPESVALEVAAFKARDRLVDVVNSAVAARPQKTVKMTPEMREAWDHLFEVSNEELKLIEYPAVIDVVDKFLEALSSEAREMLTNPALQQEHERFMTLYQISKENGDVSES